MRQRNGEITSPNSNGKYQNVYENHKKTYSKTFNNILVPAHGLENVSLSMANETKSFARMNN